jgi:hypothetical protein
MSLQYRFVGEDRREDSRASAERAFVLWLDDKKGLRVSVAADGTQQFEDGRSVSVARTSLGELSSLRMAFYEDYGSERWTTSLTVLEGSDQRWLGVDLEWVSDDPWGRPPVVSPPALVRSLLAHNTVHMGDVELPSTYFSVTANQAPALAKLLLSPERRIPIVVMTHDPIADTNTNADRAKFLHRTLTGTAPLYLLDPAAAAVLNDNLLDGMWVYGGAVRAYLPDLDAPDPLLRRHKVLGVPWLRRNMGAASRMVSEPLRRSALASRPPEFFRPLGLDAPHVDEEVNDTLRAEIASLRESLEWQAVLDEESQRALDSSSSRTRWLESELAALGAHLVGAPTPPSFQTIDIGSFEELGIAAMEHLDMVSIGNIEDGIAVLDGYPQSGAWSRRAWRSLLALNEYALAKKSGAWAGDFFVWCREPVSGTAAVISEKWVALDEDNRVGREPKFYGPRTFPTPCLDDSAAVYMPAHIKIVEGGRPAPRIHFFDDTDGRTQLIHVGYIGPHLPNGQKY